jgi:prepilin-type N-terminal cleavage/methylation domain-containing protein
MMRMRLHNGRQGGFTLLETLIALVILATGILSILLLFPIAMERHRVNTLRTMTTTIAQTQLGRLRAGDTDVNFHQWLRDNKLKPVESSNPISQHIKSWVVSSQPAGEINLGLYRVTIGLRLWDGRTEYYTTYVTDR